MKRNLSTVRITPEFTMRISTNSFGFRGPEPGEFPDDGVLFLGDSFTLGYGVDDGKEFPALIRQRLVDQSGANAPTIINAGIGENGTGRWVKFLETEGQVYNPRLVVVQIFSNDFIDNRNERLFAITPDSELAELPIQPKGWSRTVQEMIEAVPLVADTYLVGLARQALSNRNRPPPPPPVVIDDVRGPSYDFDELTYRLLEEIISICERQEWPLLALVIGIGGDRFDQIERRLDDHDVAYVTIPSKMERPDLYYIVDGHWNESGHALAAELLLTEFERQGLY